MRCAPHQLRRSVGVAGRSVATGVVCPLAVQARYRRRRPLQRSLDAVATPRLHGHSTLVDMAKSCVGGTELNAPGIVPRRFSMLLSC